MTFFLLGSFPRPLIRSNLSVILGIIFIVGCATAPYTGRNQFILVSEGQEASLGDEAGLAVVMGHEVAHALARHSAERMS
jgi:Zn-dependent protease with chaperone function